MREGVDFVTPIRGSDGLTVGDFWRWAFSDTLSNTTRGVLAEFLVGSALGCLDAPRVEWDAVDLRYRGHEIEVKTTGLVQSWHKDPTRSRPVFSIRRARGWDAAMNTYAEVPGRAAACYVFCLHTDTDPRTANPLDVATWEFYIVGTPELNERFPEQTTLALATLRSIAEPTSYVHIKRAVDLVLDPRQVGGSFA